MTNLSVNLNKVALLRNQRDIGYPHLLTHAEMILNAGADGLTIHPRPDERHIRRKDIRDVGDFLESWAAKNKKPGLELNIEGYPDQDFLRHVTAHPCHQVTLVPDDPGQRTSDHGWNINKHKEFLIDVMAQLHAAGRRVSVFIDPDPRAAEAAAAIGADRVELYTGPYGYAWEADDFGNTLHEYVQTAAVAKSCGLGINAGHDLNLPNLRTFLEHVPDCIEVSIGHAITDDALKMGWAAAVKAYLDITRTAGKLQKAS